MSSSSTSFALFPLTPEPTGLTFSCRLRSKHCYYVVTEALVYETPSCDGRAEFLAARHRERGERQELVSSTSCYSILHSTS